MIDVMHNMHHIEMNIETIAQIMGYIATVLCVIGMQFKDKKNILMSQILINSILGISFIMLGANSGAIINLVAVVQTIVVYLFDRKKIPVPLYEVVIYVVVSIGLASTSVHRPIDALPLVCSLLYTTMILQKTAKNVRLVSMANLTVWIIYDIAVNNWGAFLSAFLSAISTIVSIVRYDILKKDDHIMTPEEKAEVAEKVETE